MVQNQSTPPRYSETTTVNAKITAVESTVSFGSEAGQFQHAGIPTVVCGPGSITQAHQPDEFIAIDQLDACLDFMNRLGARLRDSA